MYSSLFLVVVISISTQGLELARWAPYHLTTPPALLFFSLTCQQVLSKVVRSLFFFFLFGAVWGLELRTYTLSHSTSSFL
jgi:hypothetical protein